MVRCVLNECGRARRENDNVGLAQSVGITAHGCVDRLFGDRCRRMRRDACCRAARLLRNLSALSGRFHLSRPAAASGLPAAGYYQQPGYYPDQGYYDPYGASAHTITSRASAMHPSRNSMTRRPPRIIGAPRTKRRSVQSSAATTTSRSRGSVVASAAVRAVACQGVAARARLRWIEQRPGYSPAAMRASRSSAPWRM